MNQASFRQSHTVVSECIRAQPTARQRRKATSSAEAVQNLRRFARPEGGARAEVKVRHDLPPEHRYKVWIFIDTLGDDRALVYPAGDYVPQYILEASAFMDDFGSLVYTSRFL